MTDNCVLTASNGMHRGLKNGGPLLSQTVEDEAAAAFLQNNLLAGLDSIFVDPLGEEEREGGGGGGGAGSDARWKKRRDKSLSLSTSTPASTSAAMASLTPPTTTSATASTMPTTPPTPPFDDPNSLDAWLNADDFLNLDVDPPMDFVSGDALDLTISGVSLAPPDWWQQFIDDAPIGGGGGGGEGGRGGEEEGDDAVVGRRMSTPSPILGEENSSKSKSNIFSGDDLISDNSLSSSSCLKGILDNDADEKLFAPSRSSATSLIADAAAKALIDSKAFVDMDLFADVPSPMLNGCDF